MPSSTQKPNLTGALAWSSDGNVGIGTNAPDKKLTVAGEIKTTVGLRFPDGTLQTTAASESPGGPAPTSPIPSSVGMLKATGSGQAITVSGTAGKVVKWNLDSTTITDSIIYDDGTYVGIGTTLPQAKLHVEGQIRTSQGSSVTPAIGIGDSNTGFYRASSSDPATIYGISGSPRIRFSDLGIHFLTTVGSIYFNDGSVQSTAPREFGIGQSWANVTASRANGTTYTNTTPRPIMVVVNFNGVVNAADILVNGTTVASCAVGGAVGYNLPLIAIVPIGGTYSVNSGGATISRWTELR